MVVDVIIVVVGVVESNTDRVQPQQKERKKVRSQLLADLKSSHLLFLYALG
jgi:hypothetical protein